MAEYIEREALIGKLKERRKTTFPPKSMVHTDTVLQTMHKDIMSIPAADVVEVSILKEFAEDVVYQFGYTIDYNGRLHLSSGGLSTLEWAFDILGWDDPKPYPEGECEWDGCHQYASCGTPTPDGYKRVCGKHFEIIQARKEAETATRMDGDRDG